MNVFSTSEDFRELKLKYHNIETVINDSTIKQFEQFFGCVDGMVEIEHGSEEYQLKDDWVWFYWFDRVFFRVYDQDLMLMFKMKFG